MSLNKPVLALLAALPLVAGCDEYKIPRTDYDRFQNLQINANATCTSGASSRYNELRAKNPDQLTAEQRNELRKFNLEGKCPRVAYLAEFAAACQDHQLHETIDNIPGLQDIINKLEQLTRKDFYCTEKGKPAVKP